MGNKYYFIKPVGPIHFLFKKKLNNDLKLKQVLQNERLQNNKLLYIISFFPKLFYGNIGKYYVVQCNTIVFNTYFTNNHTVKCYLML